MLSIVGVDLGEASSVALGDERAEAVLDDRERATQRGIVDVPYFLLEERLRSPAPGRREGGGRFWRPGSVSFAQGGGPPGCA
jgi:hypothetical protein